MSLTAWADWIGLIAGLIGLVFLRRGWNGLPSTTVRHALAGLLALVLFNSLSNSLQWSGISDDFDQFEDYIQLLIPLLWGLMVYDLLRRKVEQDLQVSAEQLRQERDLVQRITQTSPAGIILLSPEGQITYANRRAEQVFGRVSQELLGSECSLLQCSGAGLADSPAPEAQMPCRLVAQIRQPLYDLRCTIQRPDGQQVYLAVNAAPLLSASGELQGVVMTFEDITQRMQAERALKESEQKLAEAQRIAGLGRWELDFASNRLTWSDSTFSLFEIDQQAFGASYEAFLEVVHPDDLHYVDQTFKTSIQNRLPYNIAHRLQMKDGRVKWVNEICRVDYDEGGRPLRAVGTVQDISALHQAEQALSEEKERAQVTLHSIGDAVITTDARAQVEYLNPVAEALTGWTSAEARGRPLSEVFQVVNEQTRQPAPDPASLALLNGKTVGLPEHSVLISRAGQEYDIDDTAAPIRGRDGQVQGMVLVFHDVTEARRLERKIAHDAAHDTLTGLVNRREFELRLERALASAKERGAQHVLCYLDLDQFKVINDTAGHAAGDELLKQVANLLSGLFRHRDTLARLGGDEFGLLLENCPLERGVTIANEVVAQVHQMPFAWQGRIYQIGVSIGIVPLSGTSEGLAQALSQADVACYTAKDLGRGRVHVYQWQESETAQRHSEIVRAARLREALEWEQFYLYCQPIVPLSPALQAADTPPYYELLLRLLDEDGQILQPAAFIPPAERYGMMSNIDRWVIQTACRRYAVHFSGVPGPQIAINLSGNSLSDESLSDFVYAQFRLHGIPPERVCFEITETAAIHNLTQAQRFASQVHQMGGRIALDDFGSGFSSFRYLKNLPVNYLKIEGSFVREMLDNASDRVMVAAINQVGHTLGIQTIAEHVSDAAIIQELRALGVDYAQGYAVGRPLPLAEAWGNDK